jgi:porin
VNRALAARMCAKAFAAAVLLPSSPALSSPAADVTPPLAIAARETFDIFDAPKGIGLGAVVLNKIQLSGTLRGDELGLSGWSIHAQLFRFDGQSLSLKLGDIQTADNIEAVPMTRLFETYVARLWGKDDHSLAVRVGLIDLNSEFDSIDTASMMLNSSHGIGPDLSRSGLNGPSIYPVTAFGTTVTWVWSPTWTFRIGAFEGVAGSPRHPRAFFAERFKLSDGAFLIGQLDKKLTKDSRLEAGVWGYTAAQKAPGGLSAHNRGAYVSYEAPLNLLPRVSFWLRGGFANSRAQPVAGYLGGGLVQQGTLPGRPKDRIGFAIAHAIVGDRSAAALDSHHAETSFELTYQAILSRSFVVQPDIDYIRHPSGVRSAADSVAVGLRFVFVTAYPISMAASDPGDPTIPPDALLAPSD